MSEENNSIPTPPNLSSDVQRAVPVVAKKEPSKGFGTYIWKEWVRPIGEAVIIALVITTFLFTTVAIQGMSDMPTVKDGERVFVPKYETWLGKLGIMSFKRGDLVVLKPPKDAPQSTRPLPVVDKILETLRSTPLVKYVPSTPTYRPYFIKRIVAVSGDKVKLENGKLTVNDIKINETHNVPYWQSEDNFDDSSYLANSKSWPFRKDGGNKVEFIVPKNQYFVMGDNRSPGGSEDSRVFGPVTADEFSGRATFVWWPLVTRDEKTGQVSLNMRTLPRPEAFSALNADKPQPTMPVVKVKPAAVTTPTTPSTSPSSPSSIPGSGSSSLPFQHP
jgi:signal peptidase I